MTSQSHDDARLTAYVLGESRDDAERIAVERLLERSPEARAAADEIGDVATLLERELAREAAAVRGTVDVTGLLTAAEEPHAETRVVPHDDVPAGRSIAVLAAVVSVFAACLFVSIGQRSRPPVDSTIPALVGTTGSDSELLAVAGGPHELERRVVTTNPAAPLSFDGVHPEDLPAPFVGWSASLHGDRSIPLFAAWNRNERFDRLGGLASAEYGPSTFFGVASPGFAVVEDEPGGRFGGGLASISNTVLSGDDIRFDTPTSHPSGFPLPGDSGLVTKFVENPFVSPVARPVSYFDPSVETTSYDLVRAKVRAGGVPAADEVRIEELVNAFTDEQSPALTGDAVACRLEAGPCPWRESNRLVRVGLFGRAKGERRPTNATFLVDVSGSMRDGTRLPLVQQGLNDYVEQMSADDQVSIVTLADEPKVAISNGRDRREVQRFVKSLSAGGRSNDVWGFELAYGNAASNQLPDTTNRLVLVTDGGLDVESTNHPSVAALIEHQAAEGVPLDVVGVKDVNTVELSRLARLGRGRYNYVADPRTTREVFGSELSGTNPVVAKDLLVGVEFNPAHVQSYRLVGFDNATPTDGNGPNASRLSERRLTGSLRAGESVVALYEIVPRTVAPEANGASLRYQQLAPPADDPVRRELLSVAVRYRDPNGETPVERRYAMIDDPETSHPSRDFTWSTAVATYGLAVRDSNFKGTADLDLAGELAVQSVGSDTGGRRRAFVEVIRETRVNTLLAKGAEIERPEPVVADTAVERAAVGGKYTGLLKVVPAENDHLVHGEFRDWGRWSGTTYAGQSELPPAHWVYVYPNWYLWNETIQPAAVETEPAPE